MSLEKIILKTLLYLHHHYKINALTIILLINLDRVIRVLDAAF
jgi:hypothetical protein